MKLQIESGRFEDYLKELPPVIQFQTPLVQEKIQLIKSRASNDRDRAQLAFEIARDEVSHSFDTKEEHITINAEDVLEHKEGILFRQIAFIGNFITRNGDSHGFLLSKGFAQRNNRVGLCPSRIECRLFA